MKRATRITLIILICIMISIGTITAIAADVSGISMTLDGKIIDTSGNAPYIDSASRTMVPVYFIADALDAAVSWDNSTKTATFFQGGTIVLIRIGDRNLLVNGKVIVMDTEAVIRNGRTFVPVRFISEAFGIEVKWDAASRTVVMTSPIATPASEPTVSLPPVAENSGDLMSLLASGAVSVVVAGKSIDVTTVSLTNRTNRELVVIIPLGTYFVSSGTRVQNMLVREPKTVTLQAGASATALVNTACMNITRAIPGPTNDFTPMELGSTDKLARVIALCYERNASYAVTQAAVWIVTDNPLESELLYSLVYGDGGYVIKSSDLAKAREIVRDAG